MKKLKVFQAWGVAAALCILPAISGCAQTGHPASSSRSSNSADNSKVVLKVGKDQVTQSDVD
ncbi:MAG: hypothetical protein ACRD10_14960, partial [Terriglobia bacterium]